MPVVKVSRILLDLRSGAQKVCYREIRGPIDINNAPGDIMQPDLSGALKLIGICLLRFYTLTTA